MRKKIFVFAGIVLLLAAGYGLYLFNKPHSGVMHESATATLTAADLYTAYVKDEKASDLKFLSKVIAVKGTVNEVQVTDTTINIFLKGDGMNGVNCGVSLKDNNKNIPVKEGDIITVKGRCTGFLMDVVLVDCIIEK